MEDMVGVLIFVGIFALIGITALFGWLGEKKRRAKMAEVAESLGLEYFPKGNEAFSAQLGRFNLMGQGRARKLTKLILGTTDDVRIAIFDYQYTTGGGKNSQTHKQTVTAVQSGQINAPDFVLRPESIFSRMGGLLGFKDIDFDSHPRFSKMFVLKGSNDVAIREFFSPAMLDFFEEQKGISLEAVPGMILFYWPRKRVKPDNIRDSLAKAYEIYGLVLDRSETS